MTYSIVARDATTGEMGVAVQSAWFAVGDLVPWVKAGVGVVASQAASDPAYGPKGLRLMHVSGELAPAALAQLVALDEGRDHRQVAMLDVDGRVDVFTGSRCVPHAEHAIAENVACQGNLLRAPGIPAAMVAAFQAADGDLAERMMAAMNAAQALGGDARGSQSAALLVVRATNTDNIINDHVVGVRVDDHPYPLDELARIVGTQRAARLMAIGSEYLIHGQTADAIASLDKAYRIAPADTNAILLAVAAHLSAGNLDVAQQIAETTRFLPDVDWLTLARAYLVADALPNLDLAVYESIFASVHTPRYPNFPPHRLAN